MIIKTSLRTCCKAMRCTGDSRSTDSASSRPGSLIDHPSEMAANIAMRRRFAVVKTRWWPVVFAVSKRFGVDGGSNFVVRVYNSAGAGAARTCVAAAAGTSDNRVKIVDSLGDVEGTACVAAAVGSSDNRVNSDARGAGSTWVAAAAGFTVDVGIGSSSSLRSCWMLEGYGTRMPGICIPD